MAHYPYFRTHTRLPWASSFRCSLHQGGPDEGSYIGFVGCQIISVSSSHRHSLPRSRLPRRESTDEPIDTTVLPIVVFLRPRAGGVPLLTHRLSMVNVPQLPAAAKGTDTQRYPVSEKQCTQVRGISRVEKLRGLCFENENFKVLG